MKHPNVKSKRIAMLKFHPFMPDFYFQTWFNNDVKN
jgi:hypothetical protein